ncbi:MAG: type II secretion system F family protein, partial [Oscillospiraceae bacterium]|nr:type II secretion system F family protein [Oscillospiraceae bacterium]
KKEAYTDLIKRCDCKEMTSFANAVIQAEQLGISMKSVLTAQSESLRKDRMRRAQIKAEKAPVKMMVPMVIFIFPTIFIILLAPAAVNIVSVIGGG